MPLSNLTQMASCGMKAYSESRIELLNLQMLKKILEKSTQFLSSEQPYGPKSLNVSLNIAELKEYSRKTCGCGQHWTPFDLSFE